MSNFPPLGHPSDVRMRGFATRESVAGTLRWLDTITPPLGSELVHVTEAAGRILSQDITSPVDVPSFRRAMMDGYAVHAIDTLGATPYHPLLLRIVGTSRPGRPHNGPMVRGEAVEIMTGSPLPEDADAVLPAELTDGMTGACVKVIDTIPPSKNVGMPAEDVAQGCAVLRAQRRLRPQDVGVISSLGISYVPVVCQPRVRLVITGNELLPAGSTPCGAVISDANGPMLQALVKRDGGVVTEDSLAIVADDPAAIRGAMLTEADIILVSGGSSVGREDHAPMVLRECGELAIHGIAMRPSSPTGMGCIGNRVVFLLPGNPVSCLCAYDFFAGRTIRLMAGRSKDWPYRQQRLPLKKKLVSVVGRCDYARVTLEGGEVVPMAISGASILSSTTRADGFVIIPESSEGFPPGTMVEVYFYD